MCDFGSDHSFFEASKKMKEHYGVDIAPDMMRKVTEYHAERVRLKKQEGFFTRKNEPKAVVIGEIDGSMVPIVEIDEEEAKQKKDKRKCRTLKYREARLSMAFSPGAQDKRFEGTFGDTEAAGKQLKSCVERIGADKNTEIYCVGDGAVWIGAQVEEQFGSKGHYLIDFYHLCEYLCPTAVKCAPNKEKEWLGEQKVLLKQNKATKVLVNLLPHVERQEVSDEDSPVRNCYRYIKNRLHQLDYKTAIDNDLPIGSGEIESAHRYVIQKRLKIAGAWWLENNAEKMLALRTCRANDDWEMYWSKSVA